MGAVELLERVVAEHGRAGLPSDVQDEGVASPDSAGRRRDKFVVGDRLIELVALRLVDPMPEGGVDHHGDGHVGVIGHERRHRLAQLLEAGHGATFGRDV